MAGVSKMGQAVFDMKEVSTSLEACEEQDAPVVSALEELQEKHNIIHGQFLKEINKLERDYLVKYQPLYDERLKILTQHASEAVDSFWLTALMNHPAFEAIITREDCRALASLTNIRLEYLPDNPGYTLHFDFARNEFFENTTLSKSYLLAFHDSGFSRHEFLFDYALGTEIMWHEDKNLTVKVTSKTQRHKSTGEIRMVKKIEKRESFFTFFAPPFVPKNCEELSDIDDPDELSEQLQVDYELGDILKSAIIPNAIDWYTGKAAVELYSENDFCSDEEEGALNDRSKCSVSASLSED